MSTETDRIEADITQSRTRLNDTLNALGSKLSPGQMVDEVLGLAQGQAGHFASNLGRQIRDNPLPVVLVGAGIAMLFMHGRRSQVGNGEDRDAHRRFRSIEDVRLRTPRNETETDEAYETRLHDAYVEALGLQETSGETPDRFQSRVRETVRSIEHAAASVGQRVTGAVAGARQFVETEARHLGERAGAMGHNVEDFYATNPIAAGAIAMAVGAFIGGTTPLSQAERGALSGIADTALQGGAQLAERTAAEVQSRVGSVH